MRRDGDADADAAALSDRASPGRVSGGDGLAEGDAMHLGSAKHFASRIRYDPSLSVLLMVSVALGGEQLSIELGSVRLEVKLV
jgi:hypothetical protein